MCAKLPAARRAREEELPCALRRHWLISSSTPPQRTFAAFSMFNWRERLKLKQPSWLTFEQVRRRGELDFEVDLVWVRLTISIQPSRSSNPLEWWQTWSVQWKKDLLHS